MDLCRGNNKKVGKAEEKSGETKETGKSRGNVKKSAFVWLYRFLFLTLWPYMSR
jgi:hypothetical protein